MLTKSNVNYLVTLLLLFVSSNAPADDFISRVISYDYVQGAVSSGVETRTGTGVEFDILSFDVSGSYSVTPNFAVTASYGVTDADNKLIDIDYDVSELSFGVTAHKSIWLNTDIVANVVIINGEQTVHDVLLDNAVVTEDVGNLVSVGVRHLASDNVEFDLGFSRKDIYNLTSDVASFFVRLHLEGNTSVGTGYSTGDDIDAFVFNVRVDL